MNTVLLVLIALVAAMCAILIYKVRLIHLATYRLIDDAAKTRQEVESLYSQLQATASLQFALQFEKPLPPMRGWAGSPDFLLHVAHALLRDKPESVLECSSGVSTLVSARCLQLNGTGHVWSLEHDEAFAEQTRELLSQYQLADWATVVVAPLRKHEDGTIWYSDEALPPNLPLAGALVVDGPPESIGPMARAPAFSRLRARLAPGAQIFIDDAARSAETAMVEEWKKTDPSLKIEQLPTEKGLTVVTLTR